MDGGIYRWVDGWTDEGIDVPISIRLRGWRDGWTDDRLMNGWKYGDAVLGKHRRDLQDPSHL